MICGAQAWGSFSPRMTSANNALPDGLPGSALPKEQTMKQEELKCSCGGKPVRQKLPGGRVRVKCDCGKKTKPMKRTSDATREWKAMQAAKPEPKKSEAPKAAPAKKPEPKKAPAVEAKPAEKPAAKPEAKKEYKKPTFEKAAPKTVDAVQLLKLLGLMRVAAKKFLESIDALGQWVVQESGVKPGEVVGKIADIMTVKVSPELAKKLLAMIEKEKKGGKK